VRTHCKKGHDLTVDGAIFLVRGKRCCRQCRRDSKERWRRSHMAYARKRQRAYRKAHPDRVRASNTRYRHKKSGPGSSFNLRVNAAKARWRKRRSLPVHGWKCPKRIPWCDHDDMQRVQDDAPATKESLARLDAAMKAVMT
jgi:hypothetical protein